MLHLVDRTGSMSAAARELGWTHPAISRHIKRLERAAGCRSFCAPPGRAWPPSRTGRSGTCWTRWPTRRTAWTSSAAWSRTCAPVLPLAAGNYLSRSRLCSAGWAMLRDPSTLFDVPADTVPGVRGAY
ncbi:LysR family transcriptional regulator [Kutzneria sp. NPDC051319]|uniref:helix-turn-helix domain-containing protein n=1 Tax=Kutzneria sp. NPDC051319 TaxID=3155047 RepID=UPI00343699BC